MVDTTDGAEVRLGADTGDATSGMASAAASIESSLNAINATLSKFGNTHKATIREAVQNNANLSRSFLELKGSATSGFNAVAGVIERFRGVLGTLTAALAGGLIGKESVSALVGLRDAVHGLQSEFGLTSAKATELALNLKLAGVSTETYGMMAQRVSMRLHTQPQEFERLGVAIRDAHGDFLPLDQIMENTYKTMLEYKPGTDQLQFALSTVGRNAKDFKEDMENLTLTNERAKAMMQSLGIEMGSDAQEKVRQYKVEMNAFGLTLTAIGIKLGTAMLPMLTKLGELLVSYGPTVIDAVSSAYKVLASVFGAIWQAGLPVWDVLKKIVTEITTSQPIMAAVRIVIEALAIAFKVLATAIEIAMQGIYQLWTVLRTFVAILYDASKGISEFFSALATGKGWSGAVNAVKNAYTQMEADVRDGIARIVKSNEEGVERVKALWSGAKPEIISSINVVGHRPPGTKGYTGPPKGGEDTGWMENELKAFQNQYNNMMMAQGSFETWSETQTRDYWEEILAMTDLSAKQREEAENHYYDAERRVQQDNFARIIAALNAELAEYKNNAAAKIGILETVYKLEAERYGETSVQAQDAYKKILEARQEEADKVKKIAEEQAKNEVELGKLQVAAEEQNLKQLSALRLQSTQQEIAGEKLVQEQLYALQLKGFADREALAQGNLTELVKIWDEEAVAFQVNQNKMTAIEQAAERDRQQTAITAANDIQSAFATAFDEIAMNTKKLSDVFKQLVQTITADLTKLAANDVAKQLFGAGTTGGNALTGLMSKIFGGGGAVGAAGSPQVVAETANTAALGLLNATMLTLNGTMAAQSLTSGAGGLFSSTQGGGIASLFGPPAGAGSLGSTLLSLDSGTPYVPQTSLAIVHRGERIVPASQNQSYAFGGTRNNFMINGPIDTRTMAQISRQSAKAANRARRQG